MACCAVRVNGEPLLLPHGDCWIHLPCSKMLLRPFHNQRVNGIRNIVPFLAQDTLLSNIVFGGDSQVGHQSYYPAKEEPMILNV